MFNARLPGRIVTAVEIDGGVCGASGDERGPVGGGAKYKPRPGPGIGPISDVAGLIEALAGAWMKIHHNCFRCLRTQERDVIKVRGVPEKEVVIHNNWFRHLAGETAARSDGRTRVENNAYGLKRSILLASEDVQKT